MAFGLTGCEKTKSVAKEKKQVEEPVAEEKAPSIESINSMAEMEEAEIMDGQEKSVTTINSLETTNQKIEGSQTLKRYMGD